MAILQSRSAVVQSRVGSRFAMSVAAAMLAGTALAPTNAQTVDLGGATVVTNDFLTYNPAVFVGLPTEISNGTLRAIIPGANFVGFGGNLTDSLGVLAVRKEGTGSLTLSGANTHSGTTGALNGTLIAGSTTALSANSLLSIGSGVGTLAVVDLNGFDSAAAGLTGNLRGVLTSTGGPAVLTITSDVNRNYGGSLQGQVGITKRGTGLLTFTYGDPIGNASNATGPITLEAGGIRVAGVNALGSGAMSVTGASSFGNTGTDPAVFNNNIDVGAALDLAVRSATVFTLGGAISGTGAITKVGTGTLQLLGDNSYSGGTNFVGGGRTELGSDSALGTGMVTINGSTVLALVDPAVGVTLANNVTIVGQALRVETGNAGTVFGFSGAIVGTRDIVTTGGNGTLLLSGDNSGHSGSIRINSGTLALATTQSSGTGAIRLADLTTVVATADIGIGANIIGAGGTVATTIDTGAFNINVSGAVRSGPVALDSMTVSKIGSGVLTLSNAAAGVSSRNAVQDVQVAEGTLNLMGGLAGDITAAAGSSVTGAGTQFTGLTTVNGALAAGDALAGAGSIGGLTLANLTLGGGSTSIFDLGAVNALNTATTSDLVVVTGNLNLGGSLNVNALTGFGIGTYTLFTYGGAVTDTLSLGVLPVGYEYSLAIGGGNVNLIVELLDYYWDGSGPAANGVVNGGSGVWSAAGTNWTDISGNAAEPWAPGARAFFTNVGGDVSLADSTSYELLRFEASNYVISATDGVSLAATAGVIDVTGGNTATVNAELAGTGGLSKIGTGTLVLGGANTVAGGISIDGGTLAVTTAGALSTGDVTINGNTQALRFDASMTVANNINGVGVGYDIDTGANTVTLDGSLSGGGADKIGSGTLVLNNAINAQPGQLAVFAGSLIVNGGVQGDIGTIADTVLGGTGTITGTADVGGTLSAGAAPGQVGTLTAGNVSLAAVSTSLFDLGALGGTNDLVVSNGNLNLDGTLTVNALAGWNIGTGSHRLFNYTGVLTNGGLDLGGILATPPADVTYAIDTSVDGQVDLTVAYGGAFNWDGNGAPVDGVIQGGNGTWDGVGTNWTNSDGLFNLAYVDSNSTVVNFGGLPNLGATVDVVGTRTFGTLNFTRTGFTLSGAGGLDTNAGTINVTEDNTARIAVGISGIGTLAKTGTGTLNLTAVNSFEGAVSVDAGTVVLDGSFTNTGSTIAVANGATLTGSGSFAGTANFGDGAVLSPGNSPGVLTFGNLNLSNGTLLNYEFGAANTLGGPLNDQVVVTGNLLLDGVLTVTESAGGAFTAGLYNLFTYGALLGDNGVTVASLANGLAGTVQVNANANQVNLIVTQAGSIVLNWDGTDFVGVPAGPQGGNGVWNATNTNWTGLPPGEINATWQNNAVAIFGAAAGTVDVADVIGFGGLSFQVDGYVLGGAGSLATNGMTGSFAAINDGLTATINTQITGAGLLRKQGGGTLVLGGDNTNSGGVMLSSGTIALTSSTGLGTGTLTMANGTTLASAAPGLAVLNNITLLGAGRVDTAANIFTLNGVIGGGAGVLTKIGSGTLVLNAANTYAGGTALNAGTIRVGSNNALGTGGLAMAAGTTLQAGAPSLAVANDISLASIGTVDVNSTEFALSGVISGTGPLVVVDFTAGTTGVLTLSGANTYTGGTFVTFTTLRVASDVNLGAASGGLLLDGGTLWTTANLTTARDILLDIGGGTLRVAPATTLTVNGSISGSSLTKSGMGTLVLNSANTHNAGTALTAGTIVVNNSAALGTGTLTATGGTTLVAGTTGLTLANNVALLTGALTVDTGVSPAALTMSGVISGDGGLNKVNTGLLNLTGASTYTGATTVAAGTLNVTGSLASAVTVNSGASLAGTGTVGALSVLAGGSVNPGAVGTTNSATLTVTGAASLLGTYTVNVTAAGADRITAGGALTLGGTLAVAPTPTFTQFNQTFTVASGSSRTGTFATVTGLPGFGVAFNPVVEYTATQANIRLAPQSLITLLAGAGTGNAREVASAFDRAVAGGYNPQAFFNVYTSGAALPTTLLQMSGEQRATERRVVLDTNRVFRETALDRLNLGLASMAGQQVQAGDADTGSVTFFLRGAGSWGSSDTSGAATGFRTEQRGLLTGIDWAKDGLTIGAMFHYTSTDIEYRVLGGSSNVETTGGTFYAGYRKDGGLVANAGLSVAGARTTGARAITLPTFAQTLQGRTTGTTYQVFGELAYDLAGGANASVEPFARLTYVQADMQGLNETGGVAALAAAKQSYDIAVTNLGLRVGTVTAGGKVSLNASAAWQRTSGAREATTLIGIPAVGQLGSIQSVAMDPDAALLQADIGFNLSDKARMSVGYSGLIGKNNQDHGGRATLNFAF